MFKRLKQLQKLWLLSNRDPRILEVIDRMTVKEVKELPSRGDGKAVFIAEPTAAEEEIYLDNKSGWGDFYNRAHGALGTKKPNANS